MTKNYKAIVFQQGRRTEKRITKAQLPQAKQIVKTLRERGAKVTIVPCTIDSTYNFLYPHPDDIDEMREIGKYWCPYCRDWRWFRVPKAYVDPVPMSREWYLNVYRNNETKICAWCEIPLKDFYVCRANGIFEEVWSGKRSRRRKSGVRRRVSRRQAG